MNIYIGDRHLFQKFWEKIGMGYIGIQTVHIPRQDGLQCSKCIHTHSHPHSQYREVGSKH